MPRDGSGIFTLPYPVVVDGTTIESAVHNGTMSDIATQLNGPVPIIAGGTGANNAHDAMINLKGEISRQVVTNYDSFPFVSGSFASDPGATGAPNATEYFAGICYALGPEPSGILTLEARVQTNTVSTLTSGTRYVRQKWGGVWGAWYEASGSVADLDARYVNLTGDTMTGTLLVSGGSLQTTGDVFTGISGTGGVVRFGNAGTQYLYYTGTSYILNGGPLLVSDATASTSPATGALTVAGGVGIGGAVNVATTASIGTGSPLSGAKLQVQVASDQNFVVRGYDGTAFTVDAVNNVSSAFTPMHLRSSLLSVDAPTKVTDATASTSPTTGALTVAGGIGANSVYTNNLVSVSSAVFTSDISVYRQETPNIGVIYLNSTTSAQLFHDGAGYFNLVGGNLKVAGGYSARAGAGGAFGPEVFNLFYNTGVMQLWANSTNMGNITVTSDYRIKKDVIDLPGMWDTVKALRPIKYTQAQFTPPSQVKFIAEEKLKAQKEYEDYPESKLREVSTTPMFEADDVERWGFVAHELQATLTPSASTGVKDDPVAVQSPNPFTVIAALTKALQEAMTRIEALEAR